MALSPNGKYLATGSGEEYSDIKDYTVNLIEV